MSSPVGIYSNNDDYIYCLTKSKDEIVYIHNQREVEVSTKTPTMLTYNGVDYSKLGGNFSVEFESAKPPVIPGTTGRIIRVGENYVFKTCSRGIATFNEVSQEVSRILYLLAHRVPHSLCYGIYQHDDKYYIIEERLDVDRFEKDLCSFKKAISDKFSFSGLGSMIKYNPVYDAFVNFINEFSAIVKLLEEKGFGGDFKLDNMGYRVGSREICLTDFAGISPHSPYLPISWTEWTAVALREGGGNLGIYTNPISRLAYKDCAGHVGGCRNNRKTRRKNHTKRNSSFRRYRIHK